MIDNELRTVIQIFLMIPINAEKYSELFGVLKKW